MLSVERSRKEAPPVKALTLQKTSRIISKLFFVLRIIFLLGIVLIGILLAYVLMEAGRGEQFSSGTLIFGRPLTYSFAAAYFASALLLIGAYYVSLTYVYRIFYSMGQGNTPFSSHTVFCLRRITLCRLMLCLGQLPLALWLPMDVETLLTIVAKGAAAVFLLYCVCLIFQYGCALQQEVDETL